MSDDILVSKSALTTLSHGYNDAASSFTSIGFGLENKQLDPSFGLVLQSVKPAYDAAKSNTLDYLSSLGSLMSTMAQDITDAIAAYSDNDQQIMDRIAELQSRIDALEQQYNQSSGQGGTSGGGGTQTNPGYSGGYTGGGYTGGGYGGGGGGSWGGGPYTNQQNFQMPAYPSYTPSTEVPVADVDSYDGYDDDLMDIDSSVGMDIGGPTSRPDESFDIPMPPSSSHDGQTIRPDGSDDTSRVRLDLDGDGEDELILDLDDGQDAGVRIGTSEDGDRYVQVDFDGDGTPEATFVTDGDDADDAGISDDAQSEDATDGENAVDAGESDDDAADVEETVDSETGMTDEAIAEKAEEQAWQIIADTDPLHRTVEELKELFDRREPVEVPEDDSVIEVPGPVRVVPIARNFTNVGSVTA